MEIQMRKLSEIKPYGKNPRKNDDAVKYVAESIRQFGFRVPIILDASGEIVAGHTRYLAAQKLGMYEVPCISAEDMTPAQVKAFRLADNKTAEKAEWDDALLELELGDIMKDFDVEKLGFDVQGELELPEEDPSEEEIYPYDKHNVLITCTVSASPQVMQIVNQLADIEGVEIENAYT